MITTIVRHSLLIAIAAAAYYLLATNRGPWTAMFIWSIASAIAVLAGATLLRASRIGEVSWKNRVASFLIPWGWRLSGGQIGVAILVSWFVWVGIAAAISFLLPSTPDEPPGVTTRALLFIAWMVDGGLLLSLAGNIRESGGASGGYRGRLWNLVGLLVVILLGSVTLYEAGMHHSALLLGGLPLGLLVAAGFPFLVVAMIFGRRPHH